MTIYCPISELPERQMAALADGARFTMARVDGTLRAYEYEWPDLTITINVMLESKHPGHLDGLIAYAHNLAKARGVELQPEMIQRMRSMRLVLGIMVHPDFDEESRFQRLETLIGTICFNTQSLLFWEGDILDENARPILVKPA